MKTPDKKPKICGAFVALYGLIQTAAHKCGYAVAVHGSMARDFDLMAVPWTDDAMAPKTLAEAVAAACGATIPDFITLEEGKTGSNPQIKPHGRTGWTLWLGGGPYIDLSIMPRTQEWKNI